jgi:hypothetical protein
MIPSNPIVIHTQIAIKQIFGLPGDFNLAFLDYIDKDSTLQWVGNGMLLDSLTTYSPPRTQMYPPISPSQ